MKSGYSKYFFLSNLELFNEKSIIPETNCQFSSMKIGLKNFGNIITVKYLPPTSVLSILFVNKVPGKCCFMLQGN